MPRYNISGLEITNELNHKPNVLAELTDEGAESITGVKIPATWTQTGTNLSRTRHTASKLNMQRKQNNLPHPSFDLDGDGAVSAKDYFLAKFFDKD